MKSIKEIKKIASECIEIEYNAIGVLKERIDDNFARVVDLLYHSSGRIIVLAIGKSANIANKIVATFNSTGQPAVFLHAAEAIHGDLGNIQSNDIVICISRSGNTQEIKSLLPLIKQMGNKLIAITGNISSYLASQSDFILDVSVEKEACVNNLAPTTSTTAQLVMGDALAVSLLSCNNFTSQDFARFHPGGTLGKRLTVRLNDLLHDDSRASVSMEDSIGNVILEISSRRLGATVVLCRDNVKGIITDGDLRRMLERKMDISKLSAKDIMNKNPIKMSSDSLAYEALLFMQNNNINQIIVVKGEKYIGLVHIHEIIKEELI